MIRWLDDITDSMNMNLSQLWEILKQMETRHAAVQSQKDQTRLSDRTPPTTIDIESENRRYSSGLLTARSQREELCQWQRS